MATTLGFGFTTTVCCTWLLQLAFVPVTVYTNVPAAVGVKALVAPVDGADIPEPGYEAVFQE